MAGQQADKNTLDDIVFVKLVAMPNILKPMDPLCFQVALLLRSWCILINFLVDYNDRTDYFILTHRVG